MNLTFDLSPKKILGIAIALLVVLLVCTYKVNTNPSGFALTGVLFSIATLAVLVMTSKIDVVLEVLRDELEPKTGGAVSGSVNAIEPRHHRRDLEHSLVHALSAPLLERGMGGTAIGEFIKAAADSVLSACPNRAHISGHSVECLYHYALARLGLRDSDDLRVIFWDAHEALHWDDKTDRHQIPVLNGAQCPACELNGDSVGAKADQNAEAEIVAKGLTAPRVTAEQIQALMAKLTWHYEQPKGTTSTFAHAYLGRFFLTTGHSACVSPENFDAALGMKYAREQAEGKAREKLWELEGYKLYAGMRAQ